MFLYRHDSKLEGMFLIHVDDFLAAGGIHFENDIMSALLSKFSFGKVSSENILYTGISILQDEVGQ